MAAMAQQSLLGGPPPTYLPENEAASQELAAAADPATVAARFPFYCAAWAALAERAMGAGDPVAAYAPGRAQRRRAGWHGHGPIPWEHEANQGFLRSLRMLAVAAAAIGEDDEAGRCSDFLRDSSQAAVTALQAD